MKKILLAFSLVLSTLFSFSQGLTTCSVEITRPANTTPYTALDAIASSSTAPVIISFTNALATAGRTGFVMNAWIATDQAANTARYRLHLFTGTVTPINDNAVYTLLYANTSKRIGQIDFQACNTEAGGSTMAQSLNTTIRLGFKLPPNVTTVYGLLETLDAFTPASGQKFYLLLTIMQN